MSRRQEPQMSQSAIDMMKLLPEEEARRFCLYAGWHHNGDTHAMLGNGDIVDLPEVMVAFYRHLIEENKRLREMLEESLKYQIKPLTIIKDGPK
jgi:hypothetical protein